MESPVPNPSRRRLLAALLCAASLLPAFADDGEARCSVLLELRNGQYREVEFAGMRNDTLEVSGTLENGSAQSLRLPKAAISALYFEGGETLDLSKSEGKCPEPTPKPDSADAGGPSPAPAQDSAAAARPLPQPAPGRSPAPEPEPFASLDLTASEEGLPVWIDSRRTAHRTPALVDSLPPGEHLVEVRWLVENNVWAAQKTVRLRPGERRRLHLALQRVRPTLSVHSVPSGAELWIDAEPDFLRPAKHRTPFERRDVGLGVGVATLFAPGYRDTTIAFRIDAHHPNRLFVEMEPLSEAERAAQEALLARRARVSRGKTLLWASAAPLGAAVALFALADNDYALAREKKKRIEGVVVPSGPNFDRILERNRALKEQGDRKRTAAWIFTGAGGLLLLAGAVVSVDF